MSIEITQNLLDEINTFINTRFVSDLNDAGLSFPAIAFILQSVITAIDDAQQKLDKNENL